jgi:hypothetical protein
MNQDPKQHWQNEVAQRRAKLGNIRRELSMATERFKRTGYDTDGQNVAKLAGAERLAEMALDGATEQLTSAAGVRLTASRETLLAAQARITRLMANRHRERNEQIELERQRCGRMPERHIEQHLRNVFGRYDYRECVGDAADKKELARIEAELAEHDRRDAAVQGAA